MQKRVSLGDVAKAAGVDRATVSRAMSNHPHVAAATRDRLRALAQELGYRPDPALAAMARDRWLGRPRRNANVIAYVAGAGCATRAAREDVFLGAQAEAERRGWRLEVFARGDYPSAAALARVLAARAIQGMLLHLDRPGVELGGWPWERFAAVHVSLPPDRAPWLDAATPDVFETHLRAMREVLARGYVRPGLVLQGPRFLADELRRVGGALAAWHEARGRGVPPPLWWLEGGSAAEQASGLRDWVSKQRLDVVLGQSDLVAERLGMRSGAGGALGYVSLSEGPRAAPFARALPDLRGVGATALRLVAARLHERQAGPPATPLQVLVPGLWQDGPSLRRREAGAGPRPPPASRAR